MGDNFGLAMPETCFERLSKGLIMARSLSLCHHQLIPPAVIAPIWPLGLA
jgi:hypothetical protein